VTCLHFRLKVFAWLCIFTPVLILWPLCVAGGFMDAVINPRPRVVDGLILFDGVSQMVRRQL